jgi:hypothetical protein
MIGRFMLCGALVILVLSPARAQEPPPHPEAQVMAVVNQLFDAMRAADANAVTSLFHPDMEKMASSGLQRDGVPGVRFGDLDGFATAVGGASPGDFDERLGNPQIRIDGLRSSSAPRGCRQVGFLADCRHSPRRSSARKRLPRPSNARAWTPKRSRT